MKNLSKNQIYAILYLKDVKTLKNEEICSELKISKERLEDFLENDYKLFAIQKPRKTAKDLMINETMSKKDNTVSIMTQDASMAIDDQKKKPATKRTRYDDFKIR